MTDREKAIVMAHTGICMLAGEKFGVFHAYIEDIMGRPVYTHELAIQSISDEIKEKSRDDFIKLCKEEQEPCEDAISRQAVLEVIDAKAWEFCDYLISKNRNDEQKPVSHFADNLRECVREELPSVKPQPKTGHWIRCLIRNEKGGCIGAKMICSECGNDNKHDEYMIYCPNCGAKMDERREVRDKV